MFKLNRSEFAFSAADFEVSSMRMRTSKGWVFVCDYDEAKECGMLDIKCEGHD